MVCYQLSNLLLYKHELLLSKCPLTADWLLIRPVWNEISNEPLNYDPIPEHIISHTYTLPLSLPFVYFCPLSLCLLCLLLPLWLLFPRSLRLSSLDLLLFLFHAFLFLHRSQSATAVGDQTSACSTWSSTAAPAVGGAVWAAETTLMGPTVSAAERTITGNLQKSPASPATAISMVNHRYKALNCFDNNLRTLIIIHANIITHYFCFPWYEQI